MTKIKVFLGGTWNKDNDWRKERLIPQLEELGIDYFNPIVDDWTPEWQEEETRQKEICDFTLYVITKEMSGVYSIAEVTEDSIKRTKKTIFCYLEEGFAENQIKSLKAVANLVEKNGARSFSSLEEVVGYLNDQQLNSVRDLSNSLNQQIREELTTHLFFEEITKNNKG